MIAEKGVATRLWRDFEALCNERGASPETWKLIQEAGALLDLWDAAEDMAEALRAWLRVQRQGTPSDGTRCRELTEQILRRVEQGGA